MTISFENFSKDLLAPWSGELPADGDASEPRTAAMKAAFEASITHTKTRGTVLVICDDAAGARSCSDYLKSFFSDQPQLALLAKKISSDEIVLNHGPKIVVTTDKTRRPRDLLSSIRLTTGAGPAADLPSDKEIARTLCHIFLIEAHRMETGAVSEPDHDHAIALDAAACLLTMMGSDADPEAWIRENFGKRDGGRDAARWVDWKAAQKGLHRGSSLEGFPTSVPVIARETAPALPIGPMATTPANMSRPAWSALHSAAVCSRPAPSPPSGGGTDAPRQAQVPSPGSARSAIR